MVGKTLTILGCGMLSISLVSAYFSVADFETGNLGQPILSSLLSESGSNAHAKFEKYIACVRSGASEKKLGEKYPEAVKSGKLSISRGDNVQAAKDANVVLLGVDPADVEITLKQDGLAD